MVSVKGNRGVRGGSTSSGRIQLGNRDHPQQRRVISNPVRAGLNSQNDPRLASDKNNRLDHSLSSFANVRFILNTPADMSNPQVIEYLMKKGYVRTEQVLRQESAQ